VFSSDHQKRYSLAFTVFIVAIILALIVNLVNLNKERFQKSDVVRLYFADNISAAHLQIIVQFNRLYAGRIEVIPIDLPFSKFSTNERKELIARSLRSRSSRIDIFAVDQIWVPRFAKWGEPLAKYFMQTNLSKILPPALATCYYDNSLVGIPLYIDLGVMYYRKDLIEPTRDSLLIRKLKASISWEELVDYGLTHPERRPFYLFQGDGYEGLVCNYLEILGAMGGRIYQDGELAINTELGRKSAQFMSDLIHRYHLAPPEVSSYNERESYYHALTRDALFFRGWSSFLKDMPIMTRDSVKVRQLEMAYLPRFGDHPPVTVFGGWNLMISRYSTHKAEAYKFLEYILSEEVQRTLFETSGYLPILKTLYDDPQIIARNPYITYVKQLMNAGIHRPMLINYTKISDILSFYLNQLLKNQISAEEALKLIDNAIQTRNIFLK